MEEAGSTSEQSLKNTKQNYTSRTAANVSTHTLRVTMNIQACKNPKQHIVECLVGAEQKRGDCSCRSDRQRDERGNLLDGVAAGLRRAVGAREDDEEIEADLSSPKISK